MYVIVHSSQALASAQIEALVSGHPRDAKKVSVTGTDRLREPFSYATTRGVRDSWPLAGARPANNRHWKCKKKKKKTNNNNNNKKYHRIK